MTRQAVSSSNLKAVGYDAALQILEIEFLDGSVYQYKGVPQDLYNGLMNAASHGSFLDAHIKKAGFAYQKLC